MDGIDIQSVKGPIAGAPIGAAVHEAAIRGGDALPHESRKLLGNHPKSFTPAYEKAQP